MLDDFSRREVLRRLGAGTLLTCTLRNVIADEEKPKQPKQPLLTSRLHIGEDGIVTLLTGKVECGQGIRTTLTQIAAEELRLEPAQIRVLMGDTAMVPDDGGTWGSLTTPETVPLVRRACAALYELLGRCAAAEGKTGQSYGYREMVKSALLTSATSSDAAVVSPAVWRVCGKPIRAVNGQSIVTGDHHYSSDISPQGMLHGALLRAPNSRCRLISCDTSKAQQMPGIRIVREGGFVGVTAPTAHEAAAAVALIDAKWSEGKLGDPRTLFSDLKSRAKKPELKEYGHYPSLFEDGSVEAGMAASSQKLESSYQIAHIAHVPLEARVAVAQWADGGVTVQCGTQAPFVVRGEIAQALNLPEAKVRVIVSDTGSGYGAKHSSECELEAVQLAKGLTLPVRLAWSRHEEFTQSYCRPAALMEVRSGFQNDGRITAWEFHNYNGGAASLAGPYRVTNRYAAYHASEPALRQGSYRSLAAVGNTFARETHIDEIAAAMNIDPVEMRLRNTDNARLKAVLGRAAERFGWNKRRSGNGTGFGVACNVEKGGHVALFTELLVSGTEVKLIRMVAAFDAGAVINPDILSNQVEGAIIQGIGAALFEKLEFDQRQILNGRLSAYRVPRFSDIPEMEVILVDDRSTASAGAGESPITASAPSIGNALFAATGKRIRQLPLLAG